MTYRQLQWTSNWAFSKLWILVQFQNPEPRNQ